MWRFGFSKWRTTCPGKEEGVGRWWRGTALSVAVSVWTLPHLSSRCCIFRLVSVVRSRFQLFLPYRVPVSMMPKTLCPPPLAQARCNPKQEVQPLIHFPLFHSFHSEALMLGHDLPGHSFCHFVGFDGSMQQSKDWICVLSASTMAGGLWGHTDPGLNPSLPLTDSGQSIQPPWISFSHLRNFLTCKMRGSPSTGFCEVC